MVAGCTQGGGCTGSLAGCVRTSVHAGLLLLALAHAPGPGSDSWSWLRFLVLAQIPGLGLRILDSVLESWTLGFKAHSHTKPIYG